MELNFDLEMLKDLQPFLFSALFLTPQIISVRLFPTGL